LVKLMVLNITNKKVILIKMIMLNNTKTTIIHSMLFVVSKFVFMLT